MKQIEGTHCGRSIRHVCKFSFRGHRSLPVVFCCLLGTVIYACTSQYLPWHNGWPSGLSWTDVTFFPFRSSLWSDTNATSWGEVPEIFNTVIRDTSMADIRSDVEKNRQILSELLPAEKLGELARERKILLIVAYMRTGSTLTGKLFEQFPGALFGFETLRAVHDEFTTGDSDNITLRYPNNIHRSYERSDLHRVLLQEISSWLTCNLDVLSVPTLTDDFLNIFSTKLKQFYRCIYPYMYKRRKEHYARSHGNTTAWNKCLTSTTNTCRHSSLIVMKFIRLPMHLVEALMPFFPSMKVIHLIRDPRGMYNSRLKINLVNRSEFADGVHRQCKTIYTDLQVSKSIIAKHPDRLKIVKYEDMAERPTEVSKELFNFLGFNFTPKIQKFIQDMTSSSRDDCSFCVRRKNSKTTANKWRKQMKFQTVGLIDRECEESNSILGYRPFKTEKELRDVNISSSIALS